MDLSELSFSRILAQVKSTLQSLYNRADLSFSAASPFGHLLQVVEELFKLNTLHVRNVVRHYDLTNPANENRNAVRGLAVLGQHNPSRAVSASGTLRLQVKAGVDVGQEVKGGKLAVYNRTRLRNQANGLLYSLDLGTDKQTFQITAGSSIYLNVVQGEWVDATRTGSGAPNFTFNVAGRSTKDVDHYRFNVAVNSQLWSPRKSVVDMLPGEGAYTCRTGISGGLDIGFGNGAYGAVPPAGAVINVEFLETDGVEGNIPNPQANDFKFIDDVYDFFGTSVDVASVFDVTVETPVQFGAEGESVAFTRSIMPFVSTNFVLARPENFVFCLKRLGIFSVVDAYAPEKPNAANADALSQFAKLGGELVADAAGKGRLADRRLQNIISQHSSEMERTRQLIASQANASQVSLFLVPDIRNYYADQADFDYFKVPLDAFLLDDVEKERIFNYLTIDGTVSLITDVRIVDPVVKRYVVNVTIRPFADADLDNVRAEIRDRVSGYFIANERRDRIPPSDLVRIVEEVYGVDSADVSFASEEAERYHAEYERLSEEFQVANFRMPAVSEIKMSDGDPYDENWSPGIDPQLGDILIGKQDLPLMRGGWADRNGVYYAETPQRNGFGPLNVILAPVPNQSKLRALQQPKPAAPKAKLGRVLANITANINKGHAL